MAACGKIGSRLVGVPELLAELRNSLAVIETSATMVERRGHESALLARHTARTRRAVQRCEALARTIEEHADGEG